MAGELYSKVKEQPMTTQTATQRTAISAGHQLIEAARMEHYNRVKLLALSRQNGVPVFERAHKLDLSLPVIEEVLEVLPLAVNPELEIARLRLENARLRAGN